ncbi:MAG: hypothetical protein M3R24_01995 [Chloroflexota bacterium]|nr:hypothetical protein [Chloroflexota bacterium]
MGVVDVALGSGTGGVWRSRAGRWRHDGEYSGKHGGKHGGKHSGEYGGKHSGEYGGKHSGEYGGKYGGEYGGEYGGRINRSIGCGSSAERPGGEQEWLQWYAQLLGAWLSAGRYRLGKPLDGPGCRCL